MNKSEIKRRIKELDARIDELTNLAAQGNGEKYDDQISFLDGERKKLEEMLKKAREEMDR